MRSRFDSQLEMLNNEMTLMGAFCEKAIALSAKAVENRDILTAKELANLSEEIDQKEREIEGLCIKLLLQQQPVAGDLRVISSALKMVTDMERIGDQSSDIADIITKSNISANEDTSYIHDMAEAVIKMVTDSVDAFVNQDVTLAKNVIIYDDVVDSHFEKIKKILIDRLKNPNTDGEYALNLLMIAKYFERIGDHATNVARWVLYSITGSRDF